MGHGEERDAQVRGVVAVDGRHCRRRERALPPAREGAAKHVALFSKPPEHPPGGVAEPQTPHELLEEILPWVR
eukprot:7372970-Pyramimonas_sp.AAC.1